MKHTSTFFTLRDLRATLKFFLACAALIFALPGTAAGATGPDTEDSCQNFVRLPINQNRLSRKEYEVAERKADWGVRLADGLLRVEGILETADVRTNQLAARNEGWAAVIDEDRYIIGLYRLAEDTLERVQLYSNDPSSEMVSRFGLAEQALALTPQDCGNSFAVMDLGLRIDEAYYLHAIRLVDRNRDIAWGMHYRFRASNGELEHVDRLHVRCSVFTWKPEPSRVIEKPRDGSLAIRESLPGMDLPTEAQLMQLHLYPEIPDFVYFVFWTQQRYFEFTARETSFPRRYHRVDNPCVIAQPNE